MALGGPSTPNPNLGTATDRPVEPGSIQLVNADLRPASSCDDLLTWYVDHGTDRVTPWGWEWAHVYALEDSGGGFPHRRRATAASSSGSASTTPSTSSTPAPTSRSPASTSPTPSRPTDACWCGCSTTAPWSSTTSPAPSRSAWGRCRSRDVEAPELLLAGDRVVVIGHDADASEGRIGPGTRVLVVDVADPASPTVVQETAYDSSLVTARLHGGAIRLVVSRRPAEPGLRRAGRAAPESSALERNKEIVKASTLDDWLPHVTTVEADGSTTTEPAGRLRRTSASRPPTPASARSRSSGSTQRRLGTRSPTTLT